MSLLLLFPSSAHVFTSTLTAGLTAFSTARTQQTSKQAPATAQAFAAAGSKATARPVSANEAAFAANQKATIGKQHAAVESAFSASRTQTIGKTATASSSNFSIARTQLIAHTQTAVESTFAATRNQAVAKAQPASTSLFVVTRSQSIAKPQNASAKPLGATLPRQAGKAQTASSKGALASLGRAGAKQLSAVTVQAGSTARSTTRSAMVAAQASYAAAMVTIRSVGYAVAAVTAVLRGLVSRSDAKAVSASTAGLSANASRASQKSPLIGGLPAFSASGPSRLFAHTFGASARSYAASALRTSAHTVQAVSASLTGAAGRIVSKGITAFSASPAGTTARLKSFFYLMTATLAQAAGKTARTAGHSLFAATKACAARTANALAKQMPATLVSAASVSKASTLRVLNAATHPINASVGGLKSFFRAMTAALPSPVALLGRASARALAASNSFSATTSRANTKGLSAHPPAFTATIVRGLAFFRAYTATLNTWAAAAGRNTGISRIATLRAPAASVGRAIQSGMRAVLSSAGTTTRSLATQLAARTAGYSASALGSAAHGYALLLQATAQTFRALTGRNTSHTDSAAQAPSAGTTGRAIGKGLFASLQLSGVSGIGKLLLLQGVTALWDAAVTTHILTAFRRMRRLSLWVQRRLFAADVAQRTVSVWVQARGWNLASLARDWQVWRQTRIWIVTERVDFMISTTKDPMSVEDFALDWAKQIGQDTIAASSWIVPDGLTLVSSTKSATTTTARLLGGTVDQAYQVTNLVTLGSGQVLARSVLITIETA